MKKIMSDKLAILLFVGPTFILFTAFAVYPVFASVGYSFLEWDGMNASTWVGLQNYFELFQTGRFMQSLWNSLTLVMMSILIQLPIALVLALILNHGMKGEGVYRSIYFVPVLLSSVVIATLWSKIYHPDYGLLNIFLRWIGLQAWTRQWLSDPQIALCAALIPIVWQFIGYHMLLMYSACKSISPDIYEAAKIDGATSFDTDFYIVIPSIVPMLKVCLTFAAVGSLKIFDLIYILTNGGPAGATEVLSTLMYTSLFGRNRYGLGSAIAIIIIIMCMLFTFIFQRVFKPIEKSLD